MGDLYYEQLVSRKKTGKDKALSYGLLALAVLCAVAGFFVISLALLPAIILAVASYVASYFSNLEYEYVFVNGDMDIDKIVSQSRRKKVKSIKLEEIEIAAPMKSHRLDYYNGNKNLRTEDYTSGDPDSKCFALIVKDNKGLCRVLLEPEEELAKTMKNCSPGKIFLD